MSNNSGTKKKFKFTITVTKDIDVELDEEYFTQEFMTEFKNSMYYFVDLRDHAEHLAQFEARFGGLCGIDGYCGLEDGIDIIEIDEDVEVEER